MSSPDAQAPEAVPPGVDLGLLSPVRAGTAAETATGDPAVLQSLLDAETALAGALADLSLAPREAAEAIAAASDAARFDPADLAVRARAGGNPVIPLVAALTAAVPAEHAAHVHRGATSQDILDTALMLVAHRTLAPMLDDLDRTAAALAALAAAHRGTVMPGRTLTQHAVPTTFGLKAAGWRHLVLDARDRLSAVRRTLPVQLGGAAGTLAAFHAGAVPPVPGDLGLRLAAAFARRAGLAEPLLPWHTLRTPVADLAAALAFTAAALGKIAADVLSLARTEVAEVSEGRGGGSSAMPHKSNPVGATLVASAARQVPALASILVGALAAEDERSPGPWHAEWQPLREALRLTGGAAATAADLAEGLVVHPDRMLAATGLTRGLILSERAAVQLADDLGRPRARAVLDEASRRVAAEGVTLEQALAGHPFDPDPTTYLGAAAALADRALGREAAG
ncbi:3-carboxy-cis,cis-muconate cycloisomerase [Actinocorallia longicatena]|uniref:3-carboxy-cis,cis-muconate cycloisomerase n=1 Tax=Actinocorallia longicatena TaxID=111803 RepID=A0ABP6QJ23_9ACTN